MTGLDAFLQFGGLGLAGYVLVWITRSMNGKVDRLTTAVAENTKATRELCDTLKRARS